MSRTGTMALRIAAIACLALPGIAIAASPAQAAPASCSVGNVLPWDGWGQCTQGSGQYYVLGVCVNIWGTQGIAVGNVVSVGHTSWADCNTPLMIGRTIIFV
jgi:hypothetical protein